MTRPTTTGKAQDLITFTRSTTGTALAKISYGEELVTNGDFSSDSDWTLTSYLSISNGKLNLNGVNTGFIGASQPVAFVSGKLYSISVDVESVTSGRWQVFVQRTSGDLIINSELVAGSFTGNYVADGTETNLYISRNGATVLVATVNSISVKEVLYDQPDGTLQLLNHPINKPRIEYDASGNCLGLLVEEARTNLFQYSNQANQLTYHGDGATTGVDTAEVTSLAGSGTVIKLNKTSGGYGFARVSYSSTTNAQTLSAFVKKGTARYIGFRQLASNAAHTTFDLETNTWVQTVGSTSRGYEDYGNGWLRLWVVSDDSNSKTWASVCITDSGGTETNYATGTVYVYGIQREAGTFPTSYIPTSGSAVTRAGDVASLAVSEFGYNQGQGSVVVDFIPTDHPSSTYNQLIVSDGASKRWVYFNDTATYSVAGFDGTNQIAITNVLAPIKAAIGLSSTQGSIAANGDASANSTDVAHNGNILTSTSFDIAANTTAHIKSVQYYPLRLSNAQLQALTV